VPRPVWLEFIEATGRFLEPWGVQAAALGWRYGGSVGADRVRPFARVDRAGLAWFTGKGEVIAITAAAIQTPSGARQTFYRRPGEVMRG
jgi:hypothetical protein